MWLSHSVAINMGPSVMQKRSFSLRATDIPVVPGKKFVNPNFVNNFTPNYDSRFARQNSSPLIEIIRRECPGVIQGANTMCRSSKRTRNPPKSPRKSSRNNKNRQLVDDMMAVASQGPNVSETPMKGPEMSPPRDGTASLSSNEESFIIFETCERPMPRKEREVSICDSEDSFIVFDDRGCADDESEEEETDTEEDSDIDEDLDSSYSIIENKRVRFADDNLCKVHPMVKWSFAYQAARKGPWETYARDRERFKQRIFETEREIKFIFDRKHRDKVFQERFSDDDNAV